MISTRTWESAGTEMRVAARLKGADFRSAFSFTLLPHHVLIRALLIADPSAKLPHPAASRLPQFVLWCLLAHALSCCCLALKFSCFPFFFLNMDDLSLDFGEFAGFYRRVRAMYFFRTVLYKYRVDLQVRSVWIDPRYNVAYRDMPISVLFLKCRGERASLRILNRLALPAISVITWMRSPVLRRSIRLRARIHWVP